MGFAIRNWDQSYDDKDLAAIKDEIRPD